MTGILDEINVEDIGMFSLKGFFKLNISSCSVIALVSELRYLLIIPFCFTFLRNKQTSKSIHRFGSLNLYLIYQAIRGRIITDIILIGEDKSYLCG